MTALPPKTASTQPSICPFCRSQLIGTTSKEITEFTYWRCGTCGQIWNQSRLLTWKNR